MTDYRDVLDYTGPDLTNPFTYRKLIRGQNFLTFGKIQDHRFWSLPRFLELKLLRPGVWLAGGALRTLVGGRNELRDDINDYDMFFALQELADLTAINLEWQGFECVFECPLGYMRTYTRDDFEKIQLITRFYYDNPVDLIKTFDITAAQWALTHDLQVHTTYQAIHDTKFKLLNLSSVSFPVATLNRLNKYVNNNGFSMSSTVLQDYVSVVSRHDWDLEGQMALYID